MKRKVVYVSTVVAAIAPERTKTVDTQTLQCEGLNNPHQENTVATTERTAQPLGQPKHLANLLAQEYVF